jgi:lysozyme family protein
LRYDDLPVGLDYAVFDYGVNSGIGRAAKVLQRLVSVPDDGIVGPLTIAAVRGRDPKALIAAICDERLRFLQSLRIWPVFGAGWRRRVEEVRAVALAMADARPLAQRPTPVARGKGHVTRPRGPLSSGLLSVVAAAIALQDWVAAHPLVAAALGGLVLGGSMVATRVWHRATFDRRQQAATPAVAAIPLSKGTVS